MAYTVKKEKHNPFISNKEIAAEIDKTPSAVSYVKNTNFSEFEILRAGTYCKKHGISLEELDLMRRLYRSHIKSQ